MTPRTIVAWCGALLGAGLLSANPVPRALVLCITVNAVLAFSRRDQPLRPVAVLMAAGILIPVVISVLLSHAGEHAVAVLPTWIPMLGGPLTVESLAAGISAGLGVAGGIAVAVVLARALDPRDLVDVLPPQLERTATALVSALVLVPRLGRSAVAVRDAQRCRGWRPRGLRSWGDVLLPVALSAMEDSLQLAEALDARGYGSGPPTPRVRRVMRGRNAWLLVAVAGGAGLLLVARILGSTPDWYPYPALSAPPVDVITLAAVALLAVPLVACRASHSTI